MMTDRLNKIMTRDVVTITPQQTVADAYEIVKNKRYHHIPVVEGRKLVGIITSFDIMKMEVCPSTYSDHVVRDNMTTHVAYLAPDDLVGAAAEVFMEHLFHGLPVCDDQKHLVGIVTTHDILKYSYFKAYPREAATRQKRKAQITSQ